MEVTKSNEGAVIYISKLPYGFDDNAAYQFFN